MNRFRSGSVWALCVLFALVTGGSIAQDKALWTNNALGVSLGRFWSLPPRSMHLSGPERQLDIVGLHQWHLGVSYERHTAKGWSYGAIVDMSQPYFDIEAAVDDPSHGDPPGSNTAQVTGKGRFVPILYNWQALLFAGIPVHKNARWRLDAAVEAGVDPSWSTYTGTGAFHGVSTDTGYVQVFVAELGSGLDIWPLIGLRMNASYRLANHDRLMLTLEGRMSPMTYWEGSYTLYGNSAQPTVGTFSGKLAYVGLRVGYAFTWGPPRKPKWMQRQEAARDR